MPAFSSGSLSLDNTRPFRQKRISRWCVTFTWPPKSASFDLSHASTVLWAIDIAIRPFTTPPPSMTVLKYVSQFHNKVCRLLKLVVKRRGKTRVSWHPNIFQPKVADHFFKITRSSCNIPFILISSSLRHTMQVYFLWRWYMWLTCS